MRTNLTAACPASLSIKIRVVFDAYFTIPSVSGRISELLATVNLNLCSTSRKSKYFFTLFIKASFFIILLITDLANVPNKILAVLAVQKVHSVQAQPVHNYYLVIQ